MFELKHYSYELRPLTQVMRASYYQIIEKIQNMDNSISRGFKTQSGSFRQTNNFSNWTKSLPKIKMQHPNILTCNFTL